MSWQLFVFTDKSARVSDVELLTLCSKFEYFLLGIASFIPEMSTNLMSYF
jgi:hypothetical protein